MSPSRWQVALATACVLGVWGAPARGDANPPAALAHTRPAAVRPFDPEVVRAPAGSPREEVLRARAEWRWVRGRSMAERALAEASPEEQARLGWLAAMAARNVQDDAGACALLTPVAEGSSELARHARLRLASWLSETEPERALALTDAVLGELDGEVTPWPLTRYTLRLRASILAGLARTDEAIDALRALVEDVPDRFLMRDLADLLASREGDLAAQREALALYFELAHRFPTYRDGRHGEEQAATLLASLPEAERGEVGTVSLELRVTRAEALLSAFRFLDAAAAFEALLPETTNDPVARCQVRYGQAKALVKARRRSEGAPLMAGVADDCVDDPDRRAWARYYAGRAYAALGEHEPALAQYEALEAEAPTHRLADDALFRAAKVAREAGDEEGAAARLRALPDRYPNGDMGPRARFDLAWQARGEGHLEEALSHFDALLGVDEREGHEDMHGRAAYWRARTLVALDREREGVAGYAALARRWPLTYYGQQARARLRDLDPAQAERLHGALVDAQPAALTFAWRDAFDQPGFARALELLRVGETGLAEGELRALGLSGDEADEEAAWLLATLMDRAGAPDAAVMHVRGALSESLLGKVPVGRDGAYWRVAYPLAYEPLIEQTARRFSVRADFVRAVAREESSFNPGAVSPAHAYGLIQLILPTARAVARGLGMKVDPQALKRPEINLPVGTRFISGLAHRYRGQYALVPAAYNAGPAAAARWLEERGDQPLDEWIENIPYDETRHYTRRVLQSYGIYTWLSRGELLHLPLRLPAL